MGTLAKELGEKRLAAILRQKPNQKKKRRLERAGQPFKVAQNLIEVS